MKVRLTDPKTKNVVEFDWNGDLAPSPPQLEEIFRMAGLREGPSKPRSWTQAINENPIRRVVEELADPTVGIDVKRRRAAQIGLPAAMLMSGTLPALPMVGLNAALGAASSAALGEDPLAGGATNALLPLVIPPLAQGLTRTGLKGAQLAGFKTKGLAKTTDALLKERAAAPNVFDRGRRVAAGTSTLPTEAKAAWREGVGRGVSPASSSKVRARMKAVDQDIGNLVDTSPAQVDIAQSGGEAIDALRATMKTEPRPQSALTALTNEVRGVAADKQLWRLFQGDPPTLLSARDAEDWARGLLEEGKKVFASDPMTGKLAQVPSIPPRSAAALGTALRNSIKTQTPRAAEAYARKHNLYGVLKGAEQMYNPIRAAGYRAGMGSSLGAGAGWLFGVNPWLGGVGGAAAGILTNPTNVSRATYGAAEALRTAPVLYRAGQVQKGLSQSKEARLRKPR